MRSAEDGAFHFRSTCRIGGMKAAVSRGKPKGSRWGGRRRRRRTRGRRSPQQPPGRRYTRISSHPMPHTTLVAMPAMPAMPGADYGVDTCRQAYAALTSSADSFACVYVLLHIVFSIAGCFRVVRKIWYERGPPLRAETPYRSTSHLFQVISFRMNIERANFSYSSASTSLLIGCYVGPC